MAQGHKDYSGTPLWKKLGIRDEGDHVVTYSLSSQVTIPPEVQVGGVAVADGERPLVGANGGIRN